MASIYTYAISNITGATDQLVYTCPVNTSAVITNATAANTGAEARLMTGSITRGGGAPAAEDQVFINQPVQLTDDVFLDKLAGKHLTGGDEVYIKLDAAGSVNAVLDIREIVG